MVLSCLNVFHIITKIDHIQHIDFLFDRCRDCTKGSCTKTFCSQSEMDRHLVLGDCDYENKLTFHDRAKTMHSTNVYSLVTVEGDITLITI